MSEKVFWSVLGGLLLGFVAALALVVYPKISEYSTASAKLQKEVAKMKKYAKMEPAELPTRALSDKKRVFIEEWQSNVDSARRFHEDREKRLSGSISQNKALWEAGYKDDFRTLGERYRLVAKLPDDVELPFKTIENLDEKDLTLADYEKSWRVQKLLISEIIDAEGTVLEYLTQPGRQRESQNKDDPRPNFKLDQVTLKAKLAPKLLTELLTRVLGHPDLTLELASMVVGKDPRKLIPDVVQVKDSAVGDEPQVVVRLTFNVLTWSPTVAGIPPKE